ncbi:formyl peptide receptor-related sequence 6-like [Hemicordylus capensis]|uniref:formyl peptide receptor-related sequence 6-like n=1 Tax=Hemicordylus capensis TaxID=884348 RepID=UPI002302E336|nr:formyl peptide receptor-related sequence 6-like [Hemicordylus capensis]
MNKATAPAISTEAYSEHSTTHSSGAHEDCLTESWERMGIACIVMHSLISVFGVIGNGLVIFITGFRMKKTFTTVFFLNLAIADFIVTFFLPLTVAFVVHFMFYQRLDFSFGEEMCKFISIMKFLKLYSSIFFLMVISIGRYICVRYPVWARNHQTPRRALWVALGVWILSLALSCVYLNYDISVISNTQAMNESYSYLYTLSDTVSFCFGYYGNMYSSFKSDLYSMFISHIILSFILPFIVMISCYGATILRLRRSRFAQSGKPFKAMTAVTVAFFVCWFPINLMPFIEFPSQENCDLLKFFLTCYDISDILAYFNSCLNPILYVFIGRNYRESLRCSLFSELENAFQEESSPGRTKTKDSSSAMTESQNL